MDRLPTRELVLYGILGAIAFAAKYAMAFLPNIEPVSLFTMLFGAVFGRKWVYPVGVYTAIEYLFFGVGSWNLAYLYVWPILAMAANALREMQSRAGWAILSGGFGLLFGTFCSITDTLTGGLSYAFARWSAGIPFDVLHGIGNFCLTLMLFDPMRHLLEKLYIK